MSRIRFTVPVFALLLLFLATPAMAVRSTRVHVLPGIQVEYWAYSKFCPQGTPCDHRTVPAGADSVVLVPQLLQLTDDTYTFYNKIVIRIRPENGAGHIVGENDLAPLLELYPADRVADRALDYTPACNPYWLEILEELRYLQQFLPARYVFSSGSMAVKLQTDPAKGPSYNTGSDEINMPADPAWFGPGHPSLRYAIGHEFGHHMQSLAGDPVGDGMTSSHDGCFPRSSPEAAFGEGMAGSIGSEFSLWRAGWDPNTDETPCWKLTYFYEKSEVLGPYYEDNNAAFWRSLSKRNAPALWHRFMTARIALATGTTRPIRDALELLMAITGENILPDRWIANPEPNIYFPEADSLYQYWINGVEPVVIATGIGNSNNAGGWENDPNFWVRRLYPNPTPGSFRLDVQAPSSGTIAIDVFDVRGRQIHSQTFTGLTLGEHTLTITPPNLASGRYFVRYTDPVKHLVTTSKTLTIVK